MLANFDRNFEAKKETFKQKFGMDWNANPELYLNFLQTLYIASLTELVNKGFGQLSGKQDEMFNLVQNINK